MNETLHIVCPHCHITNRVPTQRLDDGAKCGKCKQVLFEKHPIELSSAGFEQHLRHNDIPLVVDFWAPWCGPCRQMAPVFEQAAAQLEPRFRLAKVNTDAEPSLSLRFNIRSIPTLMLFKGGREVARQAGANNLNALVNWIRANDR